MKTEFVALGKPLTLFATMSFALLCSCSKPVATVCEKVAMIDSVGELGEKSRVEFQWMAIKFGIDSAMRTSSGIAAHRISEGTLDAAISRYRDSIASVEDGLVSKSGCVDWLATWNSGRFDHAAMATAWVRSLKSDSASALEWESLADSGIGSLRVRVVYSLPGIDGGGIDSVILRLATEKVSTADR